MTYSLFYTLEPNNIQPIWYFQSHILTGVESSTTCVLQHTGHWESQFHVFPMSKWCCQSQGRKYNQWELASRRNTKTCTKIDRTVKTSRDFVLLTHFFTYLQTKLLVIVFVNLNKVIKSSAKSQKPLELVIKINKDQKVSLRPRK